LKDTFPLTNMAVHFLLLVIVQGSYHMYACMVTYIDPFLFEQAKQQNDGARARKKRAGGGLEWQSKSVCLQSLNSELDK